MPFINIFLSILLLSLEVKKFDPAQQMIEPPLLVTKHMTLAHHRLLLGFRKQKENI